MNIDTLLTHFDLLLDAPDAVPKLREAILQLAVQGKLTEQDPGDEPASALLECIEVEKRRLYEAGEIRKPSTVPPVNSNEVPYELPANWVWARLNDVGVINPRHNEDDELTAAFVPMSLIEDGFGTKHTFEERKYGKIRKGYTHLGEGDVVMAKITPCFQNRKSAILRGLPNKLGAGTTELYVFRPIADAILPEYVLAFLQSMSFIEGGVEQMTGTAGQQRVPRDYFEQSLLPLPPLAEQKRIVAKVDALMALCDRLEAQLQKRDAMRQKVLEAVLHGAAEPEAVMEAA